MARSDSPPARPERPQRELHTITDLRQVKVLADPLRLKILELLCQDARTTKQVAEILGEKPTKLYHHVEALEKVGLIELRRTRQNRGTLEKYYLAIARGFLADSGRFAATGKPSEESWQAIAANLLESSAVELRDLARAGEAACRGADANGIVVQLKVQAPEPRIAELQAKLEGLLKEIRELNAEDGEDEADAVPYRMTLAFYPLAETAGALDAGGDRVGPVGDDGDDDADLDPGG